MNIKDHAGLRAIAWGAAYRRRAQRTVDAIWAVEARIDDWAPQAGHTVQEVYATLCGPQEA